MRIAIPRLTFRLHDNLLLDADRVLIWIQQENIPSWSSQQLNLLLQVILAHLKELSIPAEFKVLSLKQMDTELKKLGNVDIVTDYVNDPKFSDFDNLLKKYNAHFINTFTLVNWREQPHTKLLLDYHKKRKTYSRLTPIKNYAAENALEPGSGLKPINNKKSQKPLEEMIRRLQEEMKSDGMILHKFVVGDRQILAHARKMLKIVDYKGWSKPKTRASAVWNQIESTSSRATTQLSPYLSIGALSVRWVWKELKYNGFEMGSIRDQLLWRESFHSFAVAAELGLTSVAKDFWSDKYDSKFVSNYEWRNDSEDLKKWQTGTITEFPAEDLNNAMKQLNSTGWIHHLARHLVADVFCRGKLLLNWQEGEQWFRKTLLDHDAVLNRANWMWLSAVAFSSKQKAGYHYNPNDYLRRH